MLVADLSGHDVSAALNTAMLRSIVWREAEYAKSPGGVLARLNDQLCRDLPSEHFATAVFAWFDTQESRLHYANAGHPSSYLGLLSGSWQELESGGPVLGIIPESDYPSHIIDLVQGSRLFVYTDGVTETRNPQGQFWGTGELLAILETSLSNDPCRVVERVLDAIERFRGNGPQEDDVSLMLASCL
jgi:sigma-B regulation protein RsbU (phosphoserine phosphatase)